MNRKIVNAVWLLFVVGACFFTVPISRPAHRSVRGPVRPDFGERRRAWDAPVEPYHDVVFLSSKRPILLRFHIHVDGKPLRKVWRQFIQDYANFLDADRDGKLSLAEEQNLLPLTVPRPDSTSLSPGAPWDDQWLEEPISPDNLEYSLFSTRGLELILEDPFFPTVSFLTGCPDESREKGLLNRFLIPILDRDHNGSLSPEELNLAEQRLMKLDVDQDELLGTLEIKRIYPTEIAPPPPPVYWDQSIYSSRLIRRWTQTDRHDFPSGLLIRHYARIREQTVPMTRECIGLSAESFATLDRNGDRRLDEVEMRRFWSLKPAAELEINCGQRATVRLIHGPELKISPRRSDRVTLDFGDLVIDFPCPREHPSVKPVDSEVLFRSLNKDGNGHLEENELSLGSFLHEGFGNADTNQDEKLSLNEVKAYRDRLLPIQQQYFRSAVLLALEGEKLGLFGLLNTNADRTLSIREIRQLPRLRSRLDRNGDNEITLNEMPLYFRFSFKLGSESLHRRSEMEQQQTSSGPRWFVSMDRNQDGDVSRREFVGSLKMFETLDLDHDALISSGEAKRAEATFRRAK